MCAAIPCAPALKKRSLQLHSLLAQQSQVLCELPEKKIDDAYQLMSVMACGTSAEQADRSCPGSVLSLCF